LKSTERRRNARDEDVYSDVVNFTCVSRKFGFLRVEEDAYIRIHVNVLEPTLALYRLRESKKRPDHQGRGVSYEIRIGQCRSKSGTKLTAMRGNTTCAISTLQNKPNRPLYYAFARPSCMSFVFVFAGYRWLRPACEALRGPPIELSLRPLKELISLSLRPPIELMSLMLSWSRW